MQLRLTPIRLKAIELLKSKPLTVVAFKSAMWPRPSRMITETYARKYLAALVMGGVVKKAEGDLFELTPHGAELLVAPPWICRYCGTKFVTDADRVTQALKSYRCAGCGVSHRACRKCVREQIKVLGDFPEYKVMLRECPK